MSDREKPIFYTLREVEEILQVTRRTIYNWIKDGKLTARKVGREYRVAKSDLEKFIQ